MNDQNSKYSSYAQLVVFDQDKLKVTFKQTFDLGKSQSLLQHTISNIKNGSIIAVSIVMAKDQGELSE